MEKTYSVLMSVYKNEEPEFLRISMESMFNQTIKTDDFVLICDGELTTELENIINKMESKYPKLLRVVRFNENKGLGKALQYGVKICKNNYIARMDSDDISLPNRCELQLEYLNLHKDISIVGSNVEEFIGSIENTVSNRVVPETNEEIIKFTKRRSPFNHPSVMYRKYDVIKSGNYSDVRNIQDYYLWVDMITSGCKGYNIQKNLVKMRTGEGLYKRRSGAKYLKIQLNLFNKMRKKNFISIIDYIISCSIRIISSLSPNWLRKIVYQKMLRKNN